MKSEEIDELELKLEEAIEFYGEELKNIRTGRVNPQLVEDLEIDYYGAKTPLKQAASVAAQDARTIIITPWDKDNLVNIEKAISESDLNVSPNNDGNVVRISFPPLTEERREELVKLANKKTEEARIKVRQAREEAWDKVQSDEKEGKISEDDKFKTKDKLQKMVDEYNGRIEEMSKKKMDEVMTV